MKHRVERVWRPGAPVDRAATRVLLLCAARRNAGTTTLAVLLASAMAAGGQRVLVSSGDLARRSDSWRDGDPFPRLDSDRGAWVGKGPPPLPLAPGVDLFISEQAMAGVFNETEPGPEVGFALHPSGRYDQVLVDAGSRIDGLREQVESGATRLVAVLPPERVSALATYALVKTLLESAPALQIDLLFNRAAVAGAMQVFEQIEAAVYRFLGRRIGLAGIIPMDERLRSRRADSRPLLETAALDIRARSVIRNVAANLAGKLYETPDHQRGPRYSTGG